MATEPASSAPVVLLAESAHAEHQHAELLTHAGFRVVRLPLHEITSALIRDVKPALVAIELDGLQPSDALDLAPRLRANARPRAIPVPVIVYGHGLSAPDIERAATGGAMWVQLEPSDGTKLVAAIRGVLAASGITAKRL
jgi:DNA-binding response OmpR family regulator